MSDEGNPFERYDVDPSAGPTAITERLREIAEGLEDAEERERLRADWEDLTLHPKRRLELALRAFPETRAPLEPPPRRLKAKRDPEPLDVLDLCWLPSVAEVLGLEAPELPAALPPFEDDPLLAPDDGP
jgi:hypothetical protein